MTILEYLLQNEKPVGDLTRNGLLSTRVVLYMDMYLQMKAKIKAKVPYTIAVSETAQQFRVSERTIYNAKKVMEQKFVYENRSNRTNPR